MLSADLKLEGGHAGGIGFKMLCAGGPDLDADALVALRPIDRARLCRTDTWTNHRRGSGGRA